MRLALALLVMLGIAGCDATPQSLGITGPAPVKPPPGVDDSTIANPGLPDAGSGYGPGMAPSTSGGRYFNYN